MKLKDYLVVISIDVPAFVEPFYFEKVFLNRKSKTEVLAEVFSHFNKLVSNNEIFDYKVLSIVLLSN